MFKALKELERKQYENPKVYDEHQKFLMNPNDILDAITRHFQNKFFTEEKEIITAFPGEPKPLRKLISISEVTVALKKLNNNRAAGKDNIPGELLKYGANCISPTIAKIFNNALENHEQLDINTGLLLSLQKPGKEKGPLKNLRPITLLNTIRKTLSTITLNRISDKVNTWLPHTQSGFRRGRSTTDIVFTHRWFMARTARLQQEIYITGIDMSSAFDTIDRSTMLNIAEEIFEQDECRMIRFLLSSTELEISLPGATRKNSFISNIGTPQGDSLSPVLFVIYLEHALQGIRNIDETPLPTEICYADDVDFISTTPRDNIIEVENHLAQFDLMVNKDKTEYTTVKRSNSETEVSWRKPKKVGSLLGDHEDVERRKQLAAASFNKLKSLWIRRDRVKEHTRLKLYNSVVKSVLLYNCGTWGLTKQDEEKLDTFHRRQLRSLIGVSFPQRISNINLYKRCKEKPISHTIREARWKLLGHILRMDSDAPPNKAIACYFSDDEDFSRFRGRPRTTLPVTLLNDLKTLKDPFLNLRSEDVKHLKTVADDRHSWQNLVRRICDTV